MDCVRSTGFLFWKKPCGQPSIGACDQCRMFVCQAHGGIQGDGGMLCHGCANTEDSESGDSSDSDGSWFSFGSGSSSSDGGGGSSDSSSSSDSGGGSSDSGGSSGC